LLTHRRVLKRKFLDLENEICIRFIRTQQRPPQIGKLGPQSCRVFHAADRIVSRDLR
jgi:hypothetical protein